MSQHWLVDGYNLLHALADLRSEMERDMAAAINRLLALLDDFAHLQRAKVTVVFDGSPPPSQGIVRPSSFLNVCFVGSGMKADPRIRTLIAGIGDRANLTVVSADREIANYARVCGARVETPAQFEKRLQEQASPANGEMLQKFERDLSDEEVREWLRLFSEAEDGESEP
ncbi:MAG: NYN domain-containing protein [candidate division KSB1 bacterium]|nr:NYN domain-containing protein [candidate division KSB1 bacterium]